MGNLTNPPISLRKKPRQERANLLIETILEAAVQVLKQEGAARFTTARVAEKAGVSIGSLYQYFPNKAAILFQLQVNEWHQTIDMMKKILENCDKSPFERLRVLVHTFIQSECDEAEIRGSLSDAAPLYSNAPEARRAMNEGDLVFQNFMQEILPGVEKGVREIAGELISETLTNAGKSFSEISRTPGEIKVYADAMADMFCVYIKSLENSGSDNLIV